MAVKSTEEFWAVLDKSGLLSPAHGDRARELGGELTDLKQLARLLVKENLLTTWQARQLLAGVVGLRIGKYRLLDELGRSEYGRVYLAEHQQLSRRAALKLLSRELSTNAEALRRFLVEAQSIAALDHPRLVHTLDISNDGERYFVVWEYVEGRDLQRIVQESGPLDVVRAATLVSQIADGLAHAHGHNVSHGDLKPSNVLVDAEDKLKIVDLGVARLSRTTSAPETAGVDGESASTGSGGSVNRRDSLGPIGSTDPYRAPEARGAGASPTPAADLYSLGGILYFLLAGQPPQLANLANSSSHFDLMSFDDSPTGSESTEALIAQLAALRAEVPDDLLELCRRLLATDPAKRFLSADEAKAALIAWLDAQSSESSAAAISPSATPAGSQPSAAKSSRSQPTAGRPTSSDTAESNTSAKSPPARGATPAAKPAAKQPPSKPAAKPGAESPPTDGATENSSDEATTQPRPAPRPAAPPPKRPLAKARPLTPKATPPSHDSTTLADSATIADAATVSDSISLTDSSEITPDASHESASAETGSPADDEPAPLVFKPTARRPGGGRGKPAKRPAAKTDANADSTEPGDDGAQPSPRKVPWLWIGIGAGGGGLVLVVLVVVVLWMIFGGDDKPVVATNPGDNNAAQGAPGDANAAGAGGDSATNPEAGATAASGTPDSKPNDTGTTDSAASGTEKPAEGTPSLSVKPGETPTTPTEPKPTEKPAEKPAEKPGDKPPTEPAKPETKPDTKPEPPPPAPKPEPKPAPKPMVDPFKDFPAGSVDLPALLAEGGPAPDALNPATLGQIHVDPKALVIVNLLGGAGAMKGKFRFVLEAANNGTAERDWEFFLREGEAETGGVKLAHLSLKDENLTFQWQPEAAAQPAAPYLINCQLRIATGPKNQLVSLRKPIQSAPMKAEIMKANAKGRWEIPYLPDPDKVKVELTFDPTFPKQRIEGQPVLDAEKGKMTVWFGNTPEEQTLSIKFESAVRKGVEISMEPQFRIGSIGKPERLTVASLKKAQQLVAVSQTQTFGAVQVMKGQAAKKNDELTKTRVAQLEEQLATIQRATQQLEAMKALAEQINGQGQINARVFYQNDDGTVDLLRTN